MGGKCCQRAPVTAGPVFPQAVTAQVSPNPGLSTNSPIRSHSTVALGAARPGPTVGVNGGQRANGPTARGHCSGHHCPRAGQEALSHTSDETDSQVSENWEGSGEGSDV